MGARQNHNRKGSDITSPQNVWCFDFLQNDSSSHYPLELSNRLPRPPTTSARCDSANLAVSVGMIAGGACTAAARLRQIGAVSPIYTSWATTYGDTLGAPAAAACSEVPQRPPSREQISQR